MDSRNRQARPEDSPFVLFDRTRGPCRVGSVLPSIACELFSPAGGPLDLSHLEVAITDHCFVHIVVSSNPEEHRIPWHAQRARWFGFAKYFLAVYRRID